LSNTPAADVTYYVTRHDAEDIAGNDLKAIYGRIRTVSFNNSTSRAVSVIFSHPMSD